MPVPVCIDMNNDKSQLADASTQTYGMQWPNTLFHDNYVPETANLSGQNKPVRVGRSLNVKNSL